MEWQCNKALLSIRWASEDWQLHAFSYLMVFIGNMFTGQDS